jgi:hexosaminidase
MMHYRNTVLFPIKAWQQRGMSDAECTADPSTHLAHLYIELASSDEAFLNQALLIDHEHLDEQLDGTRVMDEAYELHISTHDAVLRASSVWGVLRGLESFSQLVDWHTDSATYRIDGLPLTIRDRPALAWRGVLIDTARHFHSMASLLRLLDGMAYAKFNVLHWHLSDAQSFPFHSETLAQVNQGQYASSATYTHDDVRRVVEHARVRGIRVVPELDMPAHSASWARSIQVDLAHCPSTFTNAKHSDWKVPLDPASERTYDLIDALLHELVPLFPDAFFHIGVDEVSPACWSTRAYEAHARTYLESIDDAAHTSIVASEVPNYMLRHFLARVHDTLHRKLNRTAIMWEEAFLDVRNAHYAKPTVMQAWRCWGNYASQAKQLLLDEQQPLLWSTCFYLDWQDKSWRYYYSHLADIADVMHNEYFLGAEVALWSEYISDANLDSVAWPRAAAAVEGMWNANAPFAIGDSDDDNTPDLFRVQQRLQHFQCKLLQRGIHSAAVNPDFCFTDDLELEVQHSSNVDEPEDDGPIRPQEPNNPNNHVAYQSYHSDGWTAALTDMISLSMLISVSTALMIGYYIGRRNYRLANLRILG